MLIRLSGKTEQEIPISYTGLRPGEKLYEELLADDETTRADAASQAARGQDGGAAAGRRGGDAVDRARAGRGAGGRTPCAQWLRAQVPEYAPRGRGGALGRDAGARQHVAHQFQPHQRVVQFHQALLELPPAAAAVRTSGWPPSRSRPAARARCSGIWPGAAGLVAAATGSALPSASAVTLQVVGDGHRHVGGQPLDVGHPQAVLELVAGGDAKALRAGGADHHQAGLRVLEFADGGQRADLREGFLCCPAAAPRCPASATPRRTARRPCGIGRSCPGSAPRRCAAAAGRRETAPRPAGTGAGTAG